MLTPADGRSDGGRLSYLVDRSRFRDLDPDLFDTLAEIVSKDHRNVSELEAANVLPNAAFHCDHLSDSAAERERYFDEALSHLEPGEFVFFDPDNGLEVASVAKGRRNSAKYLYWDEFKRALGDDRVVCVYQHFPRRQRRPFVAELLGRMEKLTPGHAAFAVTTPWVAYAICAPEEQIGSLLEAASQVVAYPDLGLALIQGEACVQSSASQLTTG